MAASHRARPGLRTPQPRAPARPPELLSFFVRLDRAGLRKIDADALALGERIEVGGKLRERHTRALFLAEVGREELEVRLVAFGAVHQVHLGCADLLCGLVPVRIVLGDGLAAVLEAT